MQDLCRSAAKRKIACVLDYCYTACIWNLQDVYCELWNGNPAFPYLHYITSYQNSYCAIVLHFDLSI